MNIEQAVFGKTPDGETVNIYTIKNANGVVVKLIDYGAAIQSLKVPDKNGKPRKCSSATARSRNISSTARTSAAAVGRFANRIAGGNFTLDGKEYTLAKNNGPNHLHGGPKASTSGFGKQRSSTTTDRVSA